MIRIKFINTSRSVSLGFVFNHGFKIMPWKVEYSVDNEAMDRLHQEFIAFIDRLETESEKTWINTFQELVQHTRTHFAAEDQWMSETSFLPAFVHIEEHERVLQWLEEIADDVSKQGVESGRKKIPEIIDWFITHANTLDKALAIHMQRYTDPG